jgi:PBP1b-binding outer membrane lipoprotein LpoB
MKKTAVLAAVLILAVVIILGCSKKDSKNYIAKAGDTIITKADLDKEIANLPDFAKKMIENGSGAEGIVENIVDTMVNRELLYQEAKKKGYEKDPMYPSRVENAKKVILIGYLLEKEVDKKTVVSEQEIKDFYEKKKNLLKQDGKIVPFEAVRDMIAKNILKKKQDELFESYLGDLKKTYTVDISKKALEQYSGKKEGQPQQAQPQQNKK